MLSGVASTLMNVVVTAISYPVYLHFLGYEQYGVLIVLFTIINFVQISNLGIGPAVMKLVAEEYGCQNVQGIQKYVVTAVCSLVASGALALFALLCFQNQLISAFKLNGENARIVSCLLPYVGALSIYVFLVQVFSATLSGLGRMDLANYTESFGRVVALGVSAIMLFNGFGIVSLLIGNACSYIVVHAATYHFIRRTENLHFFAADYFDVACLKKLLKFGGGMFGGSLISMLMGPFNKLMLSRWLGVSSVPVYEIAFNGTMQVRALFEAGFRAITPEVSRVYSSGVDEAVEKIRSINHRAMKLIWALGAPFWLLLVVFIAPLLKIWLGARYVFTLPQVFQIMLIGTFFSLLGVPAFYILMGLGRTRQIFTAYVIQSIINALIVTAVIMMGYDLSLNCVALAVTLSMGCTTLYLIREKRLAGPFVVTN
jgi:O-antigen/teichoic acid export membrane protein